MNFLESLVAEWYDYQGYFIRKNIKVKKRDKGGYETEFDVIAFKPASNNTIVHIELSSDTDSWHERKKRFMEKKFKYSLKDYQSSLKVPVDNVIQIAVVGWSKNTKEDLNWGNGVTVKLIPDMIKEITTVLQGKNPANDAIPESMPLLRAMQMALCYSK